MTRLQSTVALWVGLLGLAACAGYKLGEHHGGQGRWHDATVLECFLPFDLRPFMERESGLFLCKHDKRTRKP